MMCLGEVHILFTESTGVLLSRCILHKCLTYRISYYPRLWSVIVTASLPTISSAGVITKNRHHHITKKSKLQGFAVLI